MRPRLHFAVVIATRDRPSLLARRALASVAGQDRLPDIVVVVDDSAPRHAKTNKETLRLFSETTGVAAKYLPNWQHEVAGAKALSRPPEYAGAHNRARNAGALHLLGAGFDPRHTYVAVLDDDDAWLPNHLMQAEKTARRRGADFMPCAYIRREPGQIYARTLPKFNGRDFLTGNPGVEGSTLIIRMSVFMRAGMFDESLPASDDRDLCFRLSLLSGISIIQPPEPSVVYHGDEIRRRLTQRRGSAQLAGLSCFMDKYRGWMSDKEHDAFCRRAKKLFGWKEQASPASAPAPAVSPVITTARAKNARKNIAMVIGVIADPRQKDNLLFSDILALSKDARLSSTDIVVMPSSDSCKRNLRNEMEKWRRAGLRMHCVETSAPKWRAIFGLKKSRKARPISLNRTILQMSVANLATAYKNPVCWLLDGDSRLHGLKARNGRIVPFRPDYVGEIARLRNSKCDVAIGSINGAAPLPRAFTVRTQMIDLAHMLGRLSSPGRRRHPINIAHMDGAMFAPDYYHDCAPGSHLERPLGILPAGSGARNNLIKNLPRLSERLLAGDWVTRPLLHYGQVQCLHRGGNTLVFDPAILTSLPNGFAYGNELRGIRRHDEIWRLIAEKTTGKKIVPGNFPVTQSRETDLPQAPDVGRIAGDIAGHAIAAALRHIPGKFNSPQSLVEHIMRPDSNFFDILFEFGRRREAMARASFFRIGGIANSMRAMLNVHSGGKNEKAVAAALRNMERRFSELEFAKISQKTSRLLNKTTVRKAFANFSEACAESTPIQDGLKDWARTERKSNAIHLVRKAAADTARFLGHGGEGAAFTDGRHVYKVLHRWYSRNDITDAGFLPSLAGKWPAHGAVYPIVSAQNDSGDLLLTLPFEKTLPYTGGYGAGMIALLAALKQRGIVLWDITPKNLRRKKSDVRLIDYGQHIHPFTAHDFDLMARKAWLCVRVAHRDNLRAMLTASLTNKNMPELRGYEILKTAIEQFAVRSRVPDSALYEATKEGAQRILDYGAGKGKDSVALAKQGLHIDAYDPALTAKTAAYLKKNNVNIVVAPEADNKYDAIVLRHVICEIFSDEELRRCLRHIRRLLKRNGKLVVSACDISGMAQDVVCARHIFPSAANSDRKFKYRKLIRSTGNVRKHVHRPESVLLHEFAQAGFRVASRRAFSDININRFERCGGVLQWVLKPCPPKK